MSYAVCVTFTLYPDQMDAFMPMMLANAKASFEDEAGCQRFDVLSDPARPNEVFLYELYDDAEAFQVHLAAPHFLKFDGLVSAMVQERVIKTYQNVAS